MTTCIDRSGVVIVVLKGGTSIWWYHDTGLVDDKSKALVFPNQQEARKLEARITSNPEYLQDGRYAKVLYRSAALNHYK